MVITRDFVEILEDEKEIDHPVCYFSKKKITMARYIISILEREVLALLEALQHFEVYVGSTSSFCVFRPHPIGGSVSNA